MSNETLALQGGGPIRNKLLPLYRPTIHEEDIQAVTETLRATFVSGDGPQCRQFENQLADYLGVKHVFYTNSCTAALDLAYMVKEFPAGSEVIVPDFTFTSTALAPVMNGLHVVLADVDPRNGNIDPGDVERKITERTVAISPVDYAGNPADMDRITAIARKHNLYVVHDTAQSIGAAYHGRRTGNQGDVSTFSFHGTKNLITGEGGALVTDDDSLVEKIIIAREKGTDKHSFISDAAKTGYYAYVGGGNSYVQSNILAAMGISQLARLDEQTARRKQIADRYYQELTDLKAIQLPTITPDSASNWHLFYLLLPADRKNWFQQAMRAEGIETNVHYHPLHLSPYYQQVCDYDPQGFPGAMQFFASLVRIPMYPALTDAEVESVIQAVRKVVRAMEGVEHVSL